MPAFSPIKYGLLYNWYATQEQGTGVWLVGDDMRSEGWGHVTDTIRENLKTYLIAEYPDYSFISNTDNEHGKLLKDSVTGWPSGGFGDNVVGLNIRGAGVRRGNISPIGIFEYLNVSNTSFRSAYGRHALIKLTNDVSWNGGGLPLSWGTPLRLVRPATTAEQLLPDGELAGVYYYGNDGKKYRVTKIGTQVWLADNLAETKWSDGSWIQGYDGGVYTPISDVNWAALTTAALCAYGDDMTNVFE